jgi:hypothetical protein
MDENGEISQAAPDEDKTTAEKHTNSESQDRFWGESPPLFSTNEIIDRPRGQRGR